MTKPLQIGITGGIGSGKTLVCNIFKHLGVPVYDADTRAKDLMNHNHTLIAQIKKEFGEKSYGSDGTLDRGYMSTTVFGSPGRVVVLNALVHPAVGDDYADWVKKQANPYVIKEAALLYEAGSYRGLDKIVVVAAPEALRIERVLIRDPQRTKKDVENILGNQLDEEEKIKRADFIIINDETQLVIPQVLRIHQEFLTLAKG